jgi:RNA polymerase sigma-70 factor (ECF subfamily)
MAGVSKAGTDRDRRFDELMAANAPALGRLASSFTNSASDRDDLLQEIAIAVWQALSNFRGECSERTFLFRVAHNRAVSYLARNAPREKLAACEIEIADPAPDPESGAVRSQQGERLMTAVRGLPVTYRQVVSLALEGMEYAEISEVLGISETNVGVRLNRAKQMLRAAMEVRK